MGKRFAFASVKITIGGLVCDADKMRMRVLRIMFSSVWFTLSKGPIASNHCLLLTAYMNFVPHYRAGWDSKASEVGEI